jgi:hypothetical protein
MDKFIVYIDDAVYAQQQLTPLVAGSQETQWVVVACAPGLRRHATRFLQHQDIRQWQEEWGATATAEVFSGLGANGQVIATIVPRTSLEDLTTRLHQQYGQLRVVDARRPKFGLDLPALTAGQERPPGWRLEMPSAVAGLGAALILAAE